jgi:hypothetical protein
LLFLSLFLSIAIYRLQAKAFLRLAGVAISAGVFTAFKSSSQNIILLCRHKTSFCFVIVTLRYHPASYEPAIYCLLPKLPITGGNLGYEMTALPSSFLIFLALKYMVVYFFGSFS